MNQIISDDLKLQAIQTSLRKMFKDDKYFNVCRFDDCTALLEVLVPPEIRKFLATLHCVNFADMSKELRGAIIEAINVTLGQERLDLSFIDNLRIETKIEDAEVKKVSFLKKLMHKSDE